jgi:hypothetical protein
VPHPQRALLARHIPEQLPYLVGHEMAQAVLRKAHQSELCADTSKGALHGRDTLALVHDESELGRGPIPGKGGCPPSWAATGMAIVDLAIALIVLLLASKSQPGPEIDVALEVRKTALNSLHEDARDLKLTIEAMGQEIRNVKQNVTSLRHNPLDVAAEKLLMPAALSMLRGLRSMKEHSS